MVDLNYGLWPNAALRLGFSGGGTLVSLGRSSRNSNVPISVNGNLQYGVTTPK
jgi:hypothetical protein